MNNEYQYNRCSSKGICSINPTTSSLQEIILLYLKHAVFYGLKLFEKKHYNKKIVNLVLNTISILSSNYEITENNFMMINSAFKMELPEILEEYKTLYNENNMLNTKELLEIGENINNYIRIGEKEFNKRIQSISEEKRDLYRLLFMLIKSLCINILTGESFGCKMEKEILNVFKILNLLNSNNVTISTLKKFIINTAKQDCCLMQKIRKTQIESYGEQGEYDVSFSTTKGKAILTVGSNLKELEQILDKFKNENIDIYTHDNMILAHTFPKFREYKNLKGQFGQGMENCLLDFSTFPGPIILTKHSLFNVENLYRGRLFSTDFAYTKGVIPIRNNDFSEVFESVKNSKGFKTGKKCHSEKIGFSMEQALGLIKEKMASKHFKQIFILGINGYSDEEKAYLKTLIKHIPQNVLIISCSYFGTADNLLYFNLTADIYGFLNLAEQILTQIQSKITIFFPYVERHSLSLIIYFSQFSNNGIYAGKWNQTYLNPNILKCLKDDFGILEISSPKNDLENILNTK